MIFNLSPIIYWILLTASKHQQVYTDIVHVNNNKNIRHDYIVVHLVYMDKTDIYCKLGYKKSQHI